MDKSYKTLRLRYDALSDPVRGFLSKIAPLLDSSSNYDIALAYCFMKIEEGHHRALYGGLIKKCKCDKKYANEVVSKEHMTREHFKNLFKNVFGKAVDAQAEKHHIAASKIRDGLIHGKTMSQAQLRSALSESLTYIQIVNDQVKGIASFEPYGRMQGVLSKSEVVDRATSVWIARGIGFKS